MNNLTVHDIINTPTTDVARFEAALDYLRAEGYAANGFDACCTNCGWKAAIQHPGCKKGVLFSNVQNADEAFEPEMLLVQIDGTWFDQENVDDSLLSDDTPYRLIRATQMTGPVFFQWGCPDKDQADFLATVRATFEEAGFQVVIPANRSRAIEVHPKGAI